MTNPADLRLYSELHLDRDGLDRVARMRGEIVSVCLSCRMAYDVKDPEGGAGGRSDGLCLPCFDRDYGDDRQQYEEG